MRQLNFILIVLLSSFSLPVFAGELAIPNQFTANTPAVAAEVNENFDAVEVSVDDNAASIISILARLDALEIDNASLQADLDLLEVDNLSLLADINALQTSSTSQQASIDTLETDNASLLTDNAALQNFITTVIPYLNGGMDGQGNPAVFFSGVNVLVNNGLGSTFTVNGTGNLIVGYNEEEVSNSGPNYCDTTDSGGSAFTSQITCESVGGVWTDVSLKTGSHNLIVGPRNGYTQYGGFIAGVGNVTAGVFASVSGGSNGIANAESSSVSGGTGNLANGLFSSVSGGFTNTAGGETSSVSGGANRSALAIDDWVAGGLFQTE